MQRKKAFQFTVLILGVCAIGSGIVLQPYNDSWHKLLIAVGFVFLSFSIPFIVVRIYLGTHPNKMENSAIKQGDERRTVIHEKASAKAADIGQWFILVVVIASLIAKVSSWVIYLSIALFCIQSIIKIIFVYKYNREM